MSLTARLQRLSARHLLWLALALIVLTHLPGRHLLFSTDDYLLHAQLAGSPTLAAQGMPFADPARPLGERLLRAFHFYSDDLGTTALYRHWGSLPWWSSEHALMNPMRPLAAFTHWLDFVVFGDDGRASDILSLVILLMSFGAAVTLGRQLRQPAGAAILVGLLIVMDISTSQSFQWLAARNAYLATGLGMLSLAAFLRAHTGERLQWQMLSTLLYAASLASAEAAVALPGYLLTCALLLDPRGARAGLLSLAPFILVTVAWRLAYNHAGFGSLQIGLYVDPGHSPLEFARQLLLVFPCIVASLITGVDALTSSVSHEGRVFVRLLAWVVTVAGLWLIREVLRHDRQARAMLLGSILAAIPHATLLSAGSRSGTFVAIGFFFVMVQWLSHRRVTRLPRKDWLGSAVIGWHLVVPTIVAGALSLHNLDALPADSELAAVIADDLKPGQSLVIINDHAPYQLFYLLLELDLKHRPAPASINALAPGFTPLTLTRVDATHLEITSPLPLAVNHLAPMAVPGIQAPLLSAAYGHELLQGLITTPAQRYDTQTSLSAGHLRVTPLAVSEGLPQRIRIEFTGTESPDDMLWLRYDWTLGRYEAIRPPAPGDTLHIPGPFGG